jgi:hypothetical protein
MAATLPLLIMMVLPTTGLSVNVVSKDSAFDASSLGSMGQVFQRSEKAHEQSMDNIMRSMSVPKAVGVLQKGHSSNAALMQATNLALAGNTHLRKQPKGYSGIDGARALLNDMIYESLFKYDAEIAKCTEFYSQQCAQLEICRGHISAANYVAANSRALILDAQATINQCEVEIPTKKLELKQHNLKCEHELKKLNDRLKIVMGDIAIMTTILEMTDCEKSLAQMRKFSLLRCEDECTKKSFVMFDHKGLQSAVDKLKSKMSQELMTDTFKDLFDGLKGLETMGLLHVSSKQTPLVNKTQFNNPPVPRTEVPGNPCNDPNMGAPSAADKKAAKCTIKKSPQCYKLQERFLLIQAGMEDERDDLLEQISALENFCEETKKTLETQISDAEDRLNNAQTKLAAATEKEANAGEIARQSAAENKQLSDELTKQMKTCSANYINFETELCALKKIRGELYKIKGGGHSAFFQDCEVSKWDPEECSKVCNSGEQKLTRSVLTHPNGGAKCLPLAAERSCNNQPCPVDCKLQVWSGWSKCSADCGGGVSQRLREVKLAMKYGGKPCGATSQTRACNNQACEKDCDLSSWTKWSTCSKDCDGGTQKRQKFVDHEPEGEGECPDKWSMKRLEYKKCNMKRCNTTDDDKPMSCNRTMDIILLIDGSGSLGKQGWKAEIKAAQYTVDAFTDSGKAEMAVVLYSGPRTWSGVKRCTGRNAKNVDMEACKIKTVSHFTDDLKKIKQLITGLSWPQGSTLTSLALMTAKAELALGRKDAQSAVIVYTDGRPLSFRRTELAAHAVRKASRLLWVPVTKYAPLKNIKSWATRRWQENVVKVDSFGDLEKPDVVTHIVADLCPKFDQMMRFGRTPEIR